MKRLKYFHVVVVGALSTVLIGCGDNPAAGPRMVTGDPPPAAHSGAEGHDDAHPTVGPHQGHLIELGREEYHAELTHDDDMKKVTVYLLDKQAKSAVTSADTELTLNLVVDGKPLQAKLVAEPQEGDGEGQSSRYSIVDEAVLEALEAPKTTGRLTVNLGGKSFSGRVEHLDHGEHKH
jgi:hypothetical protein